MSLADIITTGLNNPDCAFFTGAFIGQYQALNLLLIILLIGFIYKAIDKLAYVPFLDWVKKKIWKKK